jgi:hypothetical protein
VSKFGTGAALNSNNITSHVLWKESTKFIGDESRIRIFPIFDTKRRDIERFCGKLYGLKGRRRHTAHDEDFTASTTIFNLIPSPFNFNISMALAEMATGIRCTDCASK